MTLAELLGIRPGLTAVLGSGGKTSLLRRLAEELPGTVLLCTTTHIFPFEGRPLYWWAEAGKSGAADCKAGRPEGALSGLSIPVQEEALAKALRTCRVLTLGTLAPQGKLSAPALPFDTLCTLADYVLVEADGSRHFPLKAHAPWEPVLPGPGAAVVAVAGISGLGLPIQSAVHRPEIFCQLTGARPDTPVTPELAAAALCAELQAGLRADRLFLNQADTPAQMALAQRFAAAVPLPAAAGSLRTGQYQLL